MNKEEEAGLKKEVKLKGWSCCNRQRRIVFTVSRYSGYCGIGGYLGNLPGSGSEGNLPMEFGRVMCSTGKIAVPTGIGIVTDPKRKGK